jgi:hypothetical protein
MSTKSQCRTLAALAAGATLALPAASLADPPNDSLPSAAAPTAGLHRSYDRNSVNGRFAPPRSESMGVVPIHREVGPAGSESPTAATAATSFSWTDAATGGGIALLLGTGLALIARTATRRRHTSARLGS